MAANAVLASFETAARQCERLPQDDVLFAAVPEEAAGYAA
jgi:hypothetical protein